MKRIAYALVGDEILGTIASATEALAVGWRAQWFGTPCPPDAAVTVSCQSCLSRLGKNLGVALLTRHRGPLKLTETANRLLPHVRQICTTVNAIRTEISAVSGLETGSLRLGSQPGERHLAGAHERIHFAFSGYRALDFRGDRSRSGRMGPNACGRRSLKDAKGLALTASKESRRAH